MIETMHPLLQFVLGFASLLLAGAVFFRTVIRDNAKVEAKAERSEEVARRGEEATRQIHDVDRKLAEIVTQMKHLQDSLKEWVPELRTRTHTLAQHVDEHTRGLALLEQTVTRHETQLSEVLPRLVDTLSALGDGVRELVSVCREGFNRKGAESARPARRG